MSRRFIAAVPGGIATKPRLKEFEQKSSCFCRAVRLQHIAAKLRNQFAGVSLCSLDPVAFDSLEVMEFANRYLRMDALWETRPSKGKGWEVARPSERAQFEGPKYSTQALPSSHLHGLPSSRGQGSAFQLIVAL